MPGRLFKLLALVSFLIFAFGFLCFYIIQTSSEQFLYDGIAQIKPCKTGIVLGTARKMANGTENLYFTYRINAAEELFKAGKVKFLILSGDNRVNSYNEPFEMREELLKKGIPDSCLIPDCAGLRTFDRMVRCHEIFGQDSVIVISQEFHNARAIYIAKHIGLIAVGYNAKKVTTQNAIKIKFREFFSRIKCILDLYVLDTKPQHLGEKIKVG